MRRQCVPGTFHDRLVGPVILESAQQFGGEWYPMLPWLWCRWAESWTISDQASWTEWIFSYCSIAWHNLGVWERIEIPKQHRRHRHHSAPCKQLIVVGMAAVSFFFLDWGAFWLRLWEVEASDHVACCVVDWSWWKSIKVWTYLHRTRPAAWLDVLSCIAVQDVLSMQLWWKTRSSVRDGERYPSLCFLSHRVSVQFVVALGQLCSPGTTRLYFFALGLMHSLYCLLITLVLHYYQAVLHWSQKHIYNYSSALLPIPISTHPWLSS